MKSAPKLIPYNLEPVMRTDTIVNNWLGKAPHAYRMADKAPQLGVLESPFIEACVMLAWLLCGQTNRFVIGRLTYARVPWADGELTGKPQRDENETDPL